MSGHTPGPWKRDATTIRGGVNSDISIASVISYSVELEQALGNAKLIAAAPELLDVLRQIAIGRQIDGSDLNRDDMMKFARVVINTAGL